MAGPQWSLDADTEAGRFLTAAQKILVRASSLSMTNPGGLLSGRHSARHRDMHWPSEGARLGRTALAIALMLIRKRREVFAGLDSPSGLAASPMERLYECALFNCNGLDATGGLRDSANADGARSANVSASEHPHAFGRAFGARRCAYAPPRGGRWP